MPKDWNPKIQAADAAASDNFCLAISELEYDDPFSAIVFYDGTLKQPWGRIDVQREITAVTALKQDGAISYAAMSNEGDVYFTSDAGRQERLPGAGVATPGGRGAMYALLALSDGKMIAAGAENQIYRRIDDRWSADTPGVSPPQGYRRPGYGSITAIEPSELYVGGSIFPNTDAYDVTADPAYSNDMDEDALTELFMKQMNDLSAAGTDQNPAGYALHFDGTSWRGVPLGKVHPILATYAESSSSVWMVGSNGLILTGNAKNGFTDVSFHGDRDLNLLSITRFRDKMVIASDHGLHSFDGYSLSPIKPLINARRYPGVPTPLKVQAIDDVLFYFDYANHVHRWDGVNWEEIIIPPSLLERNFKALP